MQAGGGAVAGCTMDHIRRGMDYPILLRVYHSRLRSKPTGEVRRAGYLRMAWPTPGIHPYKRREVKGHAREEERRDGGRA